MQRMAHGAAMMQIEADQATCPACGAAGLEIFPLLHHMMCAYVGPASDFAQTDDGYICPKCQRAIGSNDPACEIVGTSARCTRCGKEMVVSPPPVSPQGPADR
jgi:DNA-directed RNA polymerase subunit RPC12/RpoP